nr:putative reverse transcriptase domain-containing protein [Tanacetum cinerariifolium]
MSISSDSDGPSWGIPLMNAGEFMKMDPYEEVSQQGEVHPLSPAYVPNPMELYEHVPVQQGEVHPLSPWISSLNSLRLPTVMIPFGFHVSNLKKCLSDESLVIPLDELRIDDKLHFVEEPVEIMDREIKQLKRSRIPVIKVRWNSKRGPEFTWEQEDQFKQKYPHLFTRTAPSSSVAS